MMHARRVSVGLIMIMVLHTSPPVWGDFTDGGFESGDLSSVFWHAGDVSVVEYEYVNDFSGLSQPPSTTGPDGTRAWCPAEGDYFLSMESGPATGGASMRFAFFDKPSGVPLSFSFDWFFDYGGLKPAEGVPYDLMVEVSLTTYWGIGGMDSTSLRLISINNPASPAEVEYLMDSDQNVGWSRVTLPLADMPGDGPPMGGAGSIYYALDVGMVGAASAESTFGIDNIRLEPASVVPLPGAALLGFVGLGVASHQLRRRTTRKDKRR